MSNRLTFSLASLIVLIAFGLVFVATPVFAHPSGSDERAHTHDPTTGISTDDLPALDGNADNNTDDPGEAAVSPHNYHPMVSSIEPQPSSVTTVTAFSNRQIILLDSAGAALDVTGSNDGQFNVRVTFDRPLSTGAELAVADVTFRAFDKDNAPVANIANSAAVTVSADDDGDLTIFDLTIDVPGASHFDPASLLPIDVYIDIADGAVDSPIGRSGGTALAAADSLAYKTPDTMKLTIVESLDTTAPVVTITPDLTDDDPLPASGVVTFTIASDKALGTALTDADVMVTGGTKGMLEKVMTPTAPVMEAYTLEVTPDAATDPTTPVVVAIDAEALADMYGNEPAAAATGSYTPPAAPDTTPPTVLSITGEAANNAAVFTITFSEELVTTVTASGALTLGDFEITNESMTTASVVAGPAADADGNMVVYTLTVTPEDPALAVTIQLKANAVDDLAGRANTAPSAVSSPVIVQADAVKPTVEITVDSELDDGEAVFTLTFSEALATSGDGALTLNADIVVTNGTGAELGMPTTNDDGEEVYELTVTPTDLLQPVMVEIDERSVIHDRYRNALDVTDTDNMLSASFDNRRPTATVMAPEAPESDGMLKFSLDFSEDINESTLQPGTVGVDNVGAIAEPIQDTEDSTIYTVLVTPEDPMMSTRVEIADVQDLAGNILQNEAADTYTPSVDEEVPDPTIAGPDTLSCLTGGTITVTFDEALKADEALVVGDIEITGDGWEIKNFAFVDATDTATFDLMPMSDRSWIGTTEVTVKVVANSVVDADDLGNTEEEMDFTVGPVLTIPGTDEVPGGGYIVVIRANAEDTTHLLDSRTNYPYYVGDPVVGSQFVSVQPWDCMPDLGVRLGRVNYNYDRGGTLVVDSGGGLIVKQSADHVADPDVDGSETIGDGTVGITEIMWAEDRSKLFGAQTNLDHAREQWIELHNLNNFEVKVTLFDLIRDEAFSINDYGEVDRMTNYNLPQYHGNWPIRDVGDNKDGRGQDGDSDYGEDFIAMQRGPATLTDDKHYVHGDFDGRNGGKWTKSTAVYLTRTATFARSTQIDVNKFNYDFIGTPGRSNNIVTTNPPGVTSVPLKPFVINEVGNRDNRLYDWIELRNTSGAEANLRNYQISIVTGIDNDHALFTFGNADLKIGDNELLLILASDPEDDGEHPIAVGHDVLGGTDQAPGLGPNPAKYIVAKRSERLHTQGLPAGNFVLILRHSEGVDIAKPETYNASHDKPGSADAKRGTHERIVDVAGYHNSLGDRNAGPKYTALWPLNGHGAPFTKNEFKSEGVYFRRDPARIHGENNTDKPAFVAQAYSGIGYRRHAQNVPEHGGTPGYHDIRKNLASEVTDGMVTISEIMFDRGDGDYPQWIELYNSSATIAVNLHSEAGWTLTIDNYDDGEIPLAQVSGTINFKDSEVQTILPQQTVLVTSTRARSAGSVSTNASIVFIPTRVFSVWSEKPARDAFGMEKSTDPILSERSFHIELKDGKGNSVDEVGNLIQSRGRIIDEVAWEWADSYTKPIEKGARSSVLRSYREYKDTKLVGPYTDDDILDMGVMADGWVSAHTTDFREVRGTWYGNEDDYGSPGVTGGRVLPVSLSKFRPERLDDGTIAVRWITESELNNAGFNILRSETKDGEFKQINTKLIAGQGTTSERTTYTFPDTSAKPNVVYYYQIQDVSLDGEIQTLRVTRLKGHISAAGKLTTTWGELKALQ